MSKENNNGDGRFSLRRLGSGLGEEKKPDKRKSTLVGSPVTPKNMLKVSGKLAGGQVRIHKGQVVSEVINQQGTGRNTGPDSTGRRAREIYNKIRGSKLTTLDENKYSTERQAVNSEPSLMQKALKAQAIIDEKERQNLLARKAREEKNKAAMELARLKDEQDKLMLTDGKKQDANTTLTRGLSRQADAVLHLRPHSSDFIEPDYDAMVLKVKAPTRGVEEADIPLTAVATGTYIVEEQTSGVHRIPVVKAVIPKSNNPNRKGVIAIRHAQTNEHVATSLTDKVGHKLNNIRTAAKSIITLGKPDIDSVDVPSHADLLVDVNYLKQIQDKRRQQIRDKNGS